MALPSFTHLCYSCGLWQVCELQTSHIEFLNVAQLLHQIGCGDDASSGCGGYGSIDGCDVMVVAVVAVIAVVPVVMVVGVVEAVVNTDSK